MSLIRIFVFHVNFDQKQNKLNYRSKMHANKYYLYILYDFHTIIHTHRALVSLLVTGFKLLLISTSNFIDCGQPQTMNGGKCCVCVSCANIAINKINLNELCEKLMNENGQRQEADISYLTAFIYIINAIYMIISFVGWAKIRWKFICKCKLHIIHH